MAAGEIVTVLVVEDDDVDREAVERAFRRKKIANPVVTAGDGFEALNHLRGANGFERIARPYLILLDLNMPRMNGLEFLKTLREDDKLHQSIVFVLTTSDDDRDKAAAYDHNIAGYIVKNDAAGDFLKLAQMLDLFVVTVQFPPEV